MTTEFNELLPVAHGDKVQVWIVGTRDQVLHLMNEFHVKKIASDRAILRRLFQHRLPAASI